VLCLLYVSRFLSYKFSHGVIVCSICFCYVLCFIDASLFYYPCCLYVIMSLFSYVFVMFLCFCVSILYHLSLMLCYYYYHYYYSLMYLPSACFVSMLFHYFDHILYVVCIVLFHSSLFCSYVVLSMFVLMCVVSVFVMCFCSFHVFLLLALIIICFHDLCWCCSPLLFSLHIRVYISFLYS